MKGSEHKPEDGLFARTGSGVRVWYRSTGSGPAVVLVHGFLVDHREWDPLVAHLEADFRCIVLDLPGFGNSDRPTGEEFEYTIDAYAQVVHDVLEADRSARADERPPGKSRDGRKVHVIGHSMGGGVAIALASRFPACVDQLVLVDSLCYPFRRDLRTRILGWPVIGRLLFSLFGTVALGRYFREDVFSGHTIPDRHLLKAYQTALARPGARRAAHLAFRHAIDPTVVQRHVVGIRARTLVLWGQRDRIFPERLAVRLERSIPNSVRISVPACGHAPNEELPEAVAAAVRRHFASTKPYGRQQLSGEERDFLWKQYLVGKEIYASHIDTLVKANGIAFGIAGTLLAFVLQQWTGPSYVAVALVIPALMCGSLAWAFHRTYRLLEWEIVEYDKVKELLDVRIPPDLSVVRSIFRVCSYIQSLIAIGVLATLAWQVLRPRPPENPSTPAQEAPADPAAR